MISQQEMIEIFKTLPYTKVIKAGSYQFCISTIEQEIVTKIDDQTETKNIAKPGDYIIKGIKGEFYVVTPEAFQKRYIIESVDEYLIGIANAIPEPRLAVKWDGDTIFFTSTWKEDMVCHKGDFLVAPEDLSEVYRIEKEVFFKTYESV